MDNDMIETDDLTGTPKEGKKERRHLEKKLDAIGWGLFFIWVGIAFIAKQSIGVGLLGVGILTLAVQQSINTGKYTLHIHTDRRSIRCIVFTKYAHTDS